MTNTTSATDAGHGLRARCRTLRSLHVPGSPLVLPNVWDVPSARAVVDAGFPVVATTSAGVAATLGYDDHEGAPAEQMLDAAARIARSVDVPVTVDAEAGYGMEPDVLVARLRQVGAAGCNLEDTDHATGSQRGAQAQADWLRRVRDAAVAQDYPLVINARIDNFVLALGRGSTPGDQGALLDDALERARAYAEAGADCVFPIVLWQHDAVAAFVSAAAAPVNILAIPQAPPVAALAELGAARISHGGMLHHQVMDHLAEALRSIGPAPAA